jgi:hypothetical protein
MNNPYVSICEDSQAVEMFTDTEAEYYGDWIEGEGADICLYRARETDRVIGVRLPFKENSIELLQISKDNITLNNDEYELISNEDGTNDYFKNGNSMHPTIVLSELFELSKENDRLKSVILKIEKEMKNSLNKKIDEILDFIERDF